jgi:hypothetical protein
MYTGNGIDSIRDRAQVIGIDRETRFVAHARVFATDPPGEDLADTWQQRCQRILKLAGRCAWVAAVPKAAAGLPFNRTSHRHDWFCRLTGPGSTGTRTYALDESPLSARPDESV